MTPSLRIFTHAVKMLLKQNTLLVFCLFILTIAPTLVLSVGKDASPLYNYILGGIGRLEHERYKRDVVNISDKEVKNALVNAEESVERLAYYENVLHGRNLLTAQGSPSHTAILNSWAGDEALQIARQGYILSKASYYLSYQYCLRSGKTFGRCGNHLADLFKSPIVLNVCGTQLYRTYNGSCNNEGHFTWGSSLSPYSRLLPPIYKDGIWEPRGKDSRIVSSAAEVSSAVLQHSDNSLKQVTLAVVSWAGLVTYDMAHTVSYRMIYTGDPVMCCEGTESKLAPRHRHPFCMPIVDQNETKCYNYVRSMIAPNDDYRFGPAQQMNAVSHLLDGSSLYGSTKEVAKSLRTGKGGQIKLVSTNGHDVLPSLFSSSTPLIFGEMRLNIDVMSAVLHFVLVREHNRIASELARINPNWNDEKLYHEARRIVIAEIQHITYNEWLPVVLGEKEISRRGLHLNKQGYSDVYDKNVRPSVSNSFANAAMRFTVSMVDEKLSLHDEERKPSSNMTLRFSLIKPSMLNDANVTDSLVRMLSTQNCQANDLSLPHAVTEFLYSSGNETGLDVLSLDIQRGRDHGLPPYVAFRKLFGLKYESFDDLNSSIPQEILQDLRKVYQKVNNIDLIVGGLAEIPNKGSLLGPVFSSIIAQQMATTRIGDRYFYDNKDQPYPFTLSQLNEIRKVTLARLFCDNTSVKKMQSSVFNKPNSGNQLVMCDDEIVIRRLNLKYWKQESV
ncbi:chorion peroxidase isoform X2 [Halyomorpha halys]|uniref:chorion peroxidase isoform X2 n=1 Tax=Halyomorpha halys TaxID=286706 RepID=UPI0006D4EE07|nr:chorion peroxidase isoform X2 [Halyomorpha halys]